jgi:hypothetical protein
MANMRTPAGPHKARLYEIRVRGPVGPTVLEAFTALSSHRLDGDTFLCGPLPDQSALYGVINQLEALGLELLELRQTPDCRHLKSPDMDEPHREE